MSRRRSVLKWSARSRSIESSGLTWTEHVADYLGTYWTVTDTWDAAGEPAFMVLRNGLQWGAGPFDSSGCTFATVGAAKAAIAARYYSEPV